MTCTFYIRDYCRALKDEGLFHIHKLKIKQVIVVGTLVNCEADIDANKYYSLYIYTLDDQTGSIKCHFSFRSSEIKEVETFELGDNLWIYGSLSSYNGANIVVVEKVRKINVLQRIEHFKDVKNFYTVITHCKWDYATYRPWYDDSLNFDEIDI